MNIYLAQNSDQKWPDAHQPYPGGITDWWMSPDNTKVKNLKQDDYFALVEDCAIIGASTVAWNGIDQPSELWKRTAGAHYLFSDWRTRTDAVIEAVNKNRAPQNALPHDSDLRSIVLSDFVLLPTGAEIPLPRFKLDEGEAMLGPAYATKGPPDHSTANFLEGSRLRSLRLFGPMRLPFQRSDLANRVRVCGVSFRIF